MHPYWRVTLILLHGWMVHLALEHSSGNMMDLYLRGITALILPYYIYQVEPFVHVLNT